MILNFQFFSFRFKEDRGYIDLNTLRQISQQTGLNLSELELQQMFQAADKNGDARIDRNEFVRMMRQTNLFSR
jgi:Ca2+-binding EF-hand superfamily protein